MASNAAAAGHAASWAVVEDSIAVVARSPTLRVAHAATVAVPVLAVGAPRGARSGGGRATPPPSAQRIPCMCLATLDSQAAGVVTLRVTGVARIPEAPAVVATPTKGVRGGLLSRARAAAAAAGESAAGNATTPVSATLSMVVTGKVAAVALLPVTGSGGGGSSGDASLGPVGVLAVALGSGTLIFAAVFLHFAPSPAAGGAAALDAQTGLRIAAAYYEAQGAVLAIGSMSAHPHSGTNAAVPVAVVAHVLTACAAANPAALLALPPATPGLPEPIAVDALATLHADGLLVVFPRRAIRDLLSAAAALSLAAAAALAADAVLLATPPATPGGPPPALTAAIAATMVPATGCAAALVPMLQFAKLLPPTATDIFDTDAATRSLGRVLSGALLCGRVAPTPLDVLQPDAQSSAHVLTFGARPALAAVTLSADAAPVTASRVVAEAAAKLTGSAIGFVKNWWSGGATTDAGAAKRSPPPPPPASAGPSAPVIPRRPTLRLTPRHALFVSGSEHWERPVLDPSERFAAAVDVHFGRVVVFDVASGVVSSLLKGCRLAQVAWIMVSLPAATSRANPAEDVSEPASIATTRQPRRALFLAVYLGTRGVVEVRSLRHGHARIGAFDVGPGCILASDSGRPDRCVLWRADGRCSAVTVAYRDTLASAATAVAAGTSATPALLATLSPPMTAEVAEAMAEALCAAHGRTAAAAARTALSLPLDAWPAGAAAAVLLAALARHAEAAAEAPAPVAQPPESAAAADFAAWRRPLLAALPPPSATPARSAPAHPSPAAPLLWTPGQAAHFLRGLVAVAAVHADLVAALHARTAAAATAASDAPSPSAAAASPPSAGGAPTYVVLARRADAWTYAAAAAAGGCPRASLVAAMPSATPVPPAATVGAAHVVAPPPLGVVLRAVWGGGLRLHVGDRPSPAAVGDAGAASALAALAPLAPLLFGAFAPEAVGAALAQPALAALSVPTPIAAGAYLQWALRTAAAATAAAALHTGVPPPLPAPPIEAARTAVLHALRGGDGAAACCALLRDAFASCPVGSTTANDDSDEQPPAVIVAVDSEDGVSPQLAQRASPPPPPRSPQQRQQAQEAAAVQACAGMTAAALSLVALPVDALQLTPMPATATTTPSKRRGSDGATPSPPAFAAALAASVALLAEAAAAAQGVRAVAAAAAPGVSRRFLRSIAAASCGALLRPGSAVVADAIAAAIADEAVAEAPAEETACVAAASALGRGPNGVPLPAAAVDAAALRAGVLLARLRDAAATGPALGCVHDALLWAVDDSAAPATSGPSLSMPIDVAIARPLLRMSVAFAALRTARRPVEGPLGRSVATGAPFPTGATAGAVDARTMTAHIGASQAALAAAAEAANDPGCHALTAATARAAIDAWVAADAPGVLPTTLRVALRAVSEFLAVVEPAAPGLPLGAALTPVLEDGIRTLAMCACLCSTDADVAAAFPPGAQPPFPWAAMCPHGAALSLLTTSATGAATTPPPPQPGNAACADAFSRLVVRAFGGVAGGWTIARLPELDAFASAFAPAWSQDTAAGCLYAALLALWADCPCCLCGGDGARTPLHACDPPAAVVPFVATPALLGAVCADALHGRLNALLGAFYADEAAAVAAGDKRARAQAQARVMAAVALLGDRVGSWAAAPRQAVRRRLLAANGTDVQGALAACFTAADEAGAVWGGTEADDGAAGRRSATGLRLSYDPAGIAEAAGVCHELACTLAAHAGAAATAVQAGGTSAAAAVGETTASVADDLPRCFRELRLLLRRRLEAPNEG